MLNRCSRLKHRLWCCIIIYWNICYVNIYNLLQYIYFQFLYHELCLINVTCILCKQNKYWYVNSFDDDDDYDDDDDDNNNNNNNIIKIIVNTFAITGLVYLRNSINIHNSGWKYFIYNLLLQKRSTNLVFLLR